jgi:hypothetical protein
MAIPVVGLFDETGLIMCGNGKKVQFFNGFHHFLCQV